jgi:hypothetical protein
MSVLLPAFRAETPCLICMPCPYPQEAWSSRADSTLRAAQTVKWPNPGGLRWWARGNCGRESWFSRRKTRLQGSKSPSRMPVAHVCNPSYSGVQGSRGSQFKASPGQIVLWDPILKQPTQNRSGRVVQVVELLPSKNKSLSSNPNTAERKKKKKHEKLWQVRKEIKVLRKWVLGTSERCFLGGPYG